jgi:hypothetical protein
MAEKLFFYSTVALLLFLALSPNKKRKKQLSPKQRGCPKWENNYL